MVFKKKKELTCWFVEFHMALSTRDISGQLSLPPYSFLQATSLNTRDERNSHRQYTYMVGLMGPVFPDRSKSNTPTESDSHRKF